MDKRRKIPNTTQMRELRSEFYDRVQRGELTIFEAAKEMRKVSLMTQTEFAKHRQVSLKVIKDLENGTANPTMNTLNQVAEIFGLELGFVKKRSG